MIPRPVVSRRSKVFAWVSGLLALGNWVYFDDVTGEPAWNTKPSWYHVSAQDRMIPPQTQRKMAERIHARETIELDTSHASFATRPTQVLELITNAAAAV
jgi:pimeloyl-ACP methyl ester carboxylesterase